METTLPALLKDGYKVKVQKGICLFLEKVTGDYRETRENIIWNAQSNTIIDQSVGRCQIKTFPGNIYCQVEGSSGLGVLNTKTGHLEISPDYSEIRQVHKRFFTLWNNKKKAGRVLDTDTGKIIADGITYGYVSKIKHAMGPYFEIGGGLGVFDARTAERIEGVSYHIHGYYFQLDHDLDEDTSGVINLQNGKKCIVPVRRANFKHMGASYFYVEQYLSGSRKKYSVLNFRTAKVTKIT